MACGRLCNIRYRHCLPCSSSGENHVCDNCDTSWIPEIDSNSAAPARCNKLTDADLIKDGNYLSLCGGMDCLGILAQRNSLQPEHVYSVEMSAAARKVAQKVNPPSSALAINSSRSSGASMTTVSKNRS